MPRALFEKTGNAVWISHLDLMRVFQRAFKRAGLPLTHTKGFNPRPSVSIALPMSVGVESVCELLDFDLEGESVPVEDIRDRLNAALIAGVRVREVYAETPKIRDIAYLDCTVTLEYDQGVPQGAEEAIGALFARESLTVEKKGKNGVTQQDLIPMIKTLEAAAGDLEITLRATVCCQNPTLNPMQLSAAIDAYLPQYKADFVTCRRNEIYNKNMELFR